MRMQRAERDELGQTRRVSGREVPVEKETVALCRCGASTKKPFCDGAHSKVGFRAVIADRLRARWRSLQVVRPRYDETGELRALVANAAVWWKDRARVIIRRFGDPLVS